MLLVFFVNLWSILLLSELNPMLAAPMVARPLEYFLKVGFKLDSPARSTLVGLHRGPVMDPDEDKCQNPQSVLLSPYNYQVPLGLDGYPLRGVKTSWRYMSFVSTHAYRIPQCFV